MNYIVKDGYIYLTLVTIIKSLTKKGYFLECYENENGAEIEIRFTHVDSGKKTAIWFNYENEKSNYRNQHRETEFNKQHERLIITNRCKRAAIDKFTRDEGIKLLI